MPYFSNVLSRILFITSNTLASGSGASSADVNGASSAVYVPANAKVKLSCRAVVQNDTVNTITAIKFSEGATGLTANSNIVNDVTNQEIDIYSETIINPTAGSHTYKVVYAQSAGNGNLHGNLSTHFTVELV